MDSKKQPSQERTKEALDYFSMQTITKQISSLWINPAPIERILGVNLPRRYDMFLQTQAKLFNRLCLHSCPSKKNMWLASNLLPFPDQSFDRILFSVQKPPSLQRLLYDFERVLKPEGEFILLILKHSSAWQRVWQKKNKLYPNAKHLSRAIKQALPDTSLTLLSKTPVLFSPPFLLQHIPWICPAVELFGLSTKGFFCPSAAILLHMQKRVRGHLSDLTKDPHMFSLPEGVCAFKNH